MYTNFMPRYNIIIKLRDGNVIQTDSSHIETILKEQDLKQKLKLVKTDFNRLSGNLQLVVYEET